MITAIFFDATETLIRPARPIAWHYAEVAKRHGLDVSESEIAAAFRLVWKGMPLRPATNEPRPDDDRGWWRELVSRVLNRCANRAAPADFDALFHELYERFAEPGVWELYSDVVPALDLVRADFSLGIISNFDRRLIRILDQLDIRDRFHTVALSSEIGADKPHPFIFEEALRCLRVRADEAVHVGDDPINDWQGAEAAGIRCFHLDRKTNSLLDLPHWITSRPCS